MVLYFISTLWKTIMATLHLKSNEWIKSEVKEGRAGDFEREIIQFCFSKKSLSYYEIKWQFHYDVTSQ